MLQPFANATFIAFGMPGGTEWVILLVLGLLIFGRRLPEVGRSLGRGIVEFKRGIKGIEDEIEDASSHDAPHGKESIAGTATPRLSEPAAPTPTAGDAVRTEAERGGG